MEYDYDMANYKPPKPRFPWYIVLIFLLLLVWACCVSYYLYLHLPC